MLAAAFFVTADVISRKLLSAPIGNSDEVSSYFFAISTTWAYAYWCSTGPMCGSMRSTICCPARSAPSSTSSR